MKKKMISFQGLSKILSEKELKNVMGGSGGACNSSPCNCYCESDSDCWGECKKCTPIHWQAKKVCSQN